jgi:hypothetical protein
VPNNADTSNAMGWQQPQSIPAMNATMDINQPIITQPLPAYGTQQPGRKLI